MKTIRFHAITHLLPLRCLRTQHDQKPAQNARNVQEKATNLLIITKEKYGIMEILNKEYTFATNF